MKTQDHVHDNELHAYADGQLDPARRGAVEAWLASHPDDAERVRAWQQQNSDLRALFDPILAEPLPDAAADRPVRRRTNLQRYAALVTMAVVGGVLGWVLRGESPQTLAHTLPHQAALAHVVYAPEILHPVEVSSREEAHLVGWLSKRLGAPLRAPQLRDAGFELVGGRLLPGDSGPAAQFMYQDGRGNRLTLYLRSAASGNSETAFRYAQEGKVGVFYWVDGPFGYALSGELDRPQLLQVAETLYRELNP